MPRLALSSRTCSSRTLLRIRIPSSTMHSILLSPGMIQTMRNGLFLALKKTYRLCCNALMSPVSVEIEVKQAHHRRMAAPTGLAWGLRGPAVVGNRIGTDIRVCSGDRCSIPRVVRMAQPFVSLSNAFFA